MDLAMLSLILAWQLVAGSAELPANDTDFDLRKAAPAARDGDAIIVTGRRRPSPRLIDVPGAREPILPRAQIPLFGDTRISLDVEQGEVANAPTNRAMVKVAIPF